MGRNTSKFKIILLRCVTTVVICNTIRGGFQMSRNTSKFIIILLRCVTTVVFCNTIRGGFLMSQNTNKFKIILVINQLNVQILVLYKEFIIWIYMFRALLCLSSGDQNCIVQHLVSSQLCRWPSGAQVGRGLGNSPLPTPQK